jgi:hypothetical protein
MTKGTTMTRAADDFRAIAGARRKLSRPPVKTWAQVDAQKGDPSLCVDAAKRPRLSVVDRDSVANHFFNGKNETQRQSQRVAKAIWISVPAR